MGILNWIILTPLAIIGGINVFRGFCAVLEKAEQKYDFKKEWQIGLFALIHIGGYFALFYMIIKCF